MTREQMWSHRRDTARIPRWSFPLVLMYLPWIILEDGRAWLRGDR